jgi:predicted dehydrogenase
MARFHFAGPAVLLAFHRVGMNMKIKATVAVLVAWGGVVLVGAGEIRVGIIGCDTSHALAFTETWNNPKSLGHVPGFRVVAAYRGGSPDIPQSVKLQEEIVPKLKERYGVKFYDTIQELCQNVDAVCLESLDGRPKLEQLKPVLQAKKRVFVDTPMGASYAQVAEMFRQARQARMPMFSASSLRFASNTVAVKRGAVGAVTNAITYGPCETEMHHPELFWCGIHGVEALFTIMGTGCQTVAWATNAQGRIEVTATWVGGRVGVFREAKDFHGMAYGRKGELTVGGSDGYVPLVQEISKYFTTGIPPMLPQETVDIFAFMQAAGESKRQGGAPIPLRPYLPALNRAPSAISTSGNSSESSGRSR